VNFRKQATNRLVELVRREIDVLNQLNAEIKHRESGGWPTADYRWQSIKDLKTDRLAQIERVQAAQARYNEGAGRDLRALDDGETDLYFHAAELVVAYFYGSNWSQVRVDSYEHGERVFRACERGDWTEFDKLCVAEQAAKRAAWRASGWIG
jgi:hypothetical protein